jgi:hypothetical protein
VDAETTGRANLQITVHKRGIFQIDGDPALLCTYTGDLWYLTQMYYALCTIALEVLNEIPLLPLQARV